MPVRSPRLLPPPGKHPWMHGTASVCVVLTACISLCIIICYSDIPSPDSSMCCSVCRKHCVCAQAYCREVCPCCCAPQGLDLFGGVAPSVDEAVEAAAALARDEDDRIVFLADLWLDRPATLDRLRAVLEGMETPKP